MFAVVLVEPSPKVQEELLRLSGTSFGKRLFFGPRDKSIDVLPGLPADSPAMLALKADVADRLTALLPQSPTQDGLYLDTVVTGQWQRLRNVSGYGMNPRGSPTGQQPSDVPRAFYTRADEELFNWVTTTLTSHVIPSGFTARRTASSGHPEYSRDMDVKLAALLAGSQALQDPVYQRALEKGDMRALAGIGVWLMSTKAARAQPDSVTRVQGRWTGKERSVTDWRGRRTIADKRLDLGGKLSSIRRVLGGTAEQHVRVRERVAYAVPYPINAANLTVAAGVRAAMYARFPVAFHFRDPATQERAQDARLRFPVTLDVRNFDQQQPPFMIARFIDRLPVTEHVKRALHLLVRCPVFINADIAGERGGRWLGNPLDASTFTAEHGNISGWVWNDILNAVVGTFVALLAMREVAIWQQEGDWGAQLLMILEGRHPRGRLNNKGDDTIIWSATNATRLALEEFFARPGRPAYFEAELEDGAQFLGSVLAHEGGRIRFLPNLASYLNNLLVTEYSAGSLEKPYASFGYFQRQRYYGGHPLFATVDAELERASLKHLGQPLSAIAQATLVTPPMDTELESYAAHTFFTNPASVHYKVDPRSLPRGVYEQFFFSLSTEQAWPLFGAPLLDLTRATIIEREDSHHAPGSTYA